MRPPLRFPCTLPLACALSAAGAAFAQDEAKDAPAPNGIPPGLASEAEAEAPRGLRVREPGAFEGYTLVAPLNSRAIHLVDLDGEVVHRWETDSAPGGWMYLQDDGTLVRCGREDDDPRFRGGGIGGRIQRLAPDGTVLWHWRLANERRHQHHDVEPMPGGNLLVIAWERISREDAIAAGRDPREVGEDGLWPDVVLEVRPTPPEGAEVVWEWRAWDHLVQDRDPEAPSFGSIAERPGRIDVNGDHRDTPPLTPEEIRKQRELEAQLRGLGYLGGEEPDGEEPDDPDAEEPDPAGDWLHTNAVEYHPELDLVALSTPHFSEVWVIDHSTTTAEAATGEGGRHGRGGDLLWRWGNPRMHGAGSEEGRRLFYQHDPTWVGGGAGDELRLLVFNNGRGRAGGDFSSVIELAIPFDAEAGFARPAAGEPFAPEGPAWSYSDPDGFYSAFISGAQRLPNGNTLVCSGVAGRVFEVTREGEIVWDYYNPHGGDVTPPEHAGRAPPLALYRATRLAADHPGVQRLLR